MHTNTLACLKKYTQTPHYYEEMLNSILYNLFAIYYNLTFSSYKL